MYFADIINVALEDLRPILKGKLDYKDVIRYLNKFLGDKTLKFKFEKIKMRVNHYAIGGFYDMQTDKRYIILYFSNKKDSIFIRKIKQNEFFFCLSQVIQHETIHACQWSKRDYDLYLPRTIPNNLIAEDNNEDEKYLADPDEIDAYGHDIAMEIKFYYRNKDPYKVLDEIDNARKVFSYRYYKNTFKNNKQTWEKIRYKLLRKTYKWIPHAR